MSNRVLVTGGSGFIGRHALAALAAQGHEVLALTSRSVPEPVEGVSWIGCDLSNSVSVREAVGKARASHLLHMAWQPVVGGLWSAPENFDWLLRSLELSQAFVEAGGERIVVSGSCAEYDWRAGLCSEDHTPLAPSTIYGEVKLALFHALKAYCDIKGVAFAWGRIFFVYGPDEHPSRLGAAVILSLLKGEEALCSHGMQLRDYLHAADVGEGLAALTSSDLTGDYNLASGEAIRVKDLIFALAEVLGRTDLVRLGARPAQAFEPPLIVADSSKTRRSGLAWSPRFTLETGAADTVASFKSGQRR